MKNTTSIVLLCLVYIIFFYSCNVRKHPDNYIIKEFKNEHVPLKMTLNGKKMNISGLTYPRRILNLKNHLIVSEHKTVDTLIRIIDKKTSKVARSIGVQGFGPGEIEVPWRLYSFNIEDKMFLTFSLSQKKINKFHIEDNSYYAIETYNFSDIMNLGRDYLIASDSTIMSVLIDDYDIFVEFDMEGKIIEKYGQWKYLLDDTKLTNSFISDFLKGFFNTDRTRNYYGLACIEIDRIELLNKRENTITSIRGPIHHMPKYRITYSYGAAQPIFDEDTNYYCYVDLTFGEKSIYALFSGESSYEVNKATDGKYCNHIYVFDLDGNPQVHYQLNYTIAAFAVDEEERKFYGITFNEDPADVIMFDF
jgi:hypothetical protein